MCGFYGIIDFTGNISEQDKEDVSRGSDLAKYRGPDDSKIYSTKHICLKFNRLSIIDLSADCQPFVSKNEEIVLVCNGEIYNFKELRNILKQKNYIFKTDNDIEVLLHGYQEWGTKLFQMIEGMFSIVIWDKSKRKVLLIRDHVGIKPLHYQIKNGKLYFSTDYNSFKGSSLYSRDINYESLLSYFSFRYVIGEKTFYKNIFDVIPGNFVTYDGDSLIKKVYWDIELNNGENKFNENHYKEELENHLDQAVKSHLMSDVPLGAFISGGLDSSLILYFMKKYKDQISTFSTGFKEKGYSEIEYVNLINEQFKTDLTYIEMKEIDFVNNIEKTINYRGEPVSIPHETAFLRMSEVMKKDISVVLSGEGADEFFGGYGRLFRSPHDLFKRNLLNKNKIPPINHFIENYAWFNDYDKRTLLNLEFFHNKKFDDYSIEYLNNIFQKYNNKTYYEQMFYVMPKVHLPNMLNRLDRMTMAASVEARVPFLDKRLVEFVSKMPVEYKIRWKNRLSKYLGFFLNSNQISEKYDIPKYILKQLAVGKIHSNVINRKKIAFPLPMNRWLDSSLKNIARDILLNSNSNISEFINISYLNKFLDNDSFASKEDLDGKKIWMLINLELWLKQNK